MIPDAPEGLREALGVQNRVWLGALAAVPDGAPVKGPIGELCGGYVDHFTLNRGAAG